MEGLGFCYFFWWKIAGCEVSQPPVQPMKLDSWEPHMAMSQIAGCPMNITNLIQYVIEISLTYTGLMVSNLFLFSISYMGCHPKPIVPNSMIFRGRSTTKQNNYNHPNHPINLLFIDNQRFHNMRVTSNYHPFIDGDFPWNQPSSDKGIYAPWDVHGMPPGRDGSIEKGHRCREEEGLPVPCCERRQILWWGCSIIYLSPEDEWKHWLYAAIVTLGF